MKTLILNGSPRKNGDTAQLLELAKAQLQGTYHVVSAYTADIHPCIDCRHCQKQFGCIFADEMEAVYTYLKDCDRILLASPFFRINRFAVKCNQSLATLFLRTIFQKRTDSAAYSKGGYGIGWWWNWFAKKGI